MRTKIISGIVGAVACTAFAIGAPAPASAAEEDSATSTIGEILERLRVPHAPCIDCW